SGDSANRWQNRSASGPRQFRSADPFAAIMSCVWNAGGGGKCCVGTSLVTASASSNIAFDGTCRATTPWSPQPIASVALRWPSGLGSANAAEDREQQRHRNRLQREGDRDDHERPEADRSRRQTTHHHGRSDSG